MKTISIGLSPNTTNEDTKKALQNLFSPFNYLQGSSTKSLEQWFRNYFSVSYAVSFNAGRSALYIILKVLGISKNDEVILQAFTCVVVPNAIIAFGAKPVYVDINSELTIDPEDLKRKITKKTKAIIVQHTFGIPANMKEIQKIAHAHAIPVIEDCAHTLGGKYEKRKLGTLGDVAFFSFGRDKPFSSVFGGMAITNNENLGKKLRNFQKNIQYPQRLWAIQQLLHPLASSVVLPTYNFLNIGKAVLVALQKIHALSFPVSPMERNGKFNLTFVQKFPNALADLALLQLRKINEYNTRRTTIAQLYIKKLTPLPLDIVYTDKNPLLRFPILVNNPDHLIAYLRKNNVYAGKWYSEVIDPKDTDLSAVFYEKGSSKVAEKLAKKIVNLPLNPTMTLADAGRIIELLHTYENFRNSK